MDLVFLNSEDWADWSKRSLDTVAQSCLEDLGLVVSTVQTLAVDSSSFGLPTHETAIFFEGELVEHCSYYCFDNSNNTIIKAKEGHVGCLLRINSIKNIKLEDLPLLINSKDTLTRLISRKRLCG